MNMPEGTSVIVDGKRCQLHYFTGKVLSSQKQKETQVHSQSYGTQNAPQVHVSSTTVDHHELFLADSTGKERAFKMVNFDFPCRDGQTLSIVWGIPEGSPDGPFIKVHNHNTGESHVNGVKQVSLWFKKPWWMIWGAALGGAIVLWIIGFFITGFLWLFVPPLYFLWRSRQAAKSLIASDGVRQLDGQLGSVKPVAA
jgi:hypothetical protein